MNWFNWIGRFFFGEKWITEATFYSNACKIFTPSNEWEKWLYEANGKLYWRTDGYTRVLSVAEKKMVLEVLMKKASTVFTRRRIVSCGNPWIDQVLSLTGRPDDTRIRNVVLPAFRISALKPNTTFPVAHEASQRLIQAEAITNLEEIVGAYILKVTNKTLFGYEINPREMPAFLKHAKTILTEGPTWREFINIYIPPAIRKYLPAWPVFNETSINFFRDFAVKAQTQRAELLSNLEDESEKPKDLLQFLMEARQDGIMNDDEIIAQFLMMFIAGYDTNSSGIRCALTHLAFHTEMQERLYEEISKVEEDYAAIKDLVYLKAVLNESLRMCPGAVTFERTAEIDYEFEQPPKIKVKAGQVVSIPVCCINNDPEIFPSPDQFIPDRFLAGSGGKLVYRKPTQFMPFGVGLRMCIGRPLALILMKCFLVVVVKKFEFRLPEGVKPPFGYEEKQGQLKFKEIPIIFKQREQKPVAEVQD